jgi:hypothetical protein
MRIASLALLLMASWTASAQAVWKYVDEQGVTHYTDQPVPGAQKIELRSGSAAPVGDQSTVPTATNVSQQNQGPYRIFEIVKPGDQESVVNTGGLVQVSMQLAPAVLPGHTIRLYLDGKLVESSVPNALMYDLQEVPRGIHTLLGVIQDDDGRRLLETSKVTFTVRQNSIAKPPVGPTLRSPTKPPSARPPTQRAQPSFAELHPKAAAAAK